MKKRILSAVKIIRSGSTLIKVLGYADPQGDAFPSNFILSANSLARYPTLWE